MEIKTALEARGICEKFRKDLASMNYNSDLNKMLNNVERMVTEVSKLEVYCRRTSHRTVLEEPLKALNDAVRHLGKLILIAKLVD